MAVNRKNKSKKVSVESKNRILLFKQVWGDFGLVNIESDTQKRFFATYLFNQLLSVHFFGK